MGVVGRAMIGSWTTHWKHVRKSNWAHHFPPRTGQVIVSSCSPKTMKIPKRIFEVSTYCWWTKSCTSWYGKYPIIDRWCKISSIHSTSANYSSSINPEPWIKDFQFFFWGGREVGSPLLKFHHLPMTYHNVFLIHHKKKDKTAETTAHDHQKPGKKATAHLTHIAKQTREIHQVVTIHEGLTCFFWWENLKDPWYLDVPGS